MTTDNEREAVRCFVKQKDPVASTLSATLLRLYIGNDGREYEDEEGRENEERKVGDEDN